MLNPSLWLGFLVMLALAGFSGYRHGVKVTTNEHAAEAGKAMTAMIDRHNELASADIKAAVVAETARQDRRRKNMEAEHELQLEAERNHRPECVWTERARGLLNDIIDRANGAQDAAAGVSDGLRLPPAPAGSAGPRREGLGGAGGGRLWRMPVEAR